MSRLASESRADCIIQKQVTYKVPKRLNHHIDISTQCPQGMKDGAETYRNGWPLPPIPTWTSVSQLPSDLHIELYSQTLKKGLQRLICS